MVSQILSTGSYLPERVVRNADLTQFSARALPHIAMKTGVLERRHAEENQATSDLAANAALRCLCRSGLDPEEIDGIILATSSPDQPMPATSSLVQTRIGAKNAFAFDVNSACTGSIVGLRIADSMIRSGVARHILVLASEVLTRFQDPNDFSTYPYFGDGAGAVLLGATEYATRPYITQTVLHSDGRGADLIRILAGGSRVPFSRLQDPRLQYFQMTGRAVFDFAVEKGTELIGELCRLCQLDKSNVRHLVLHQANIHIIAQIAQKTGIPQERFVMNLDRYGNTGAASPLIAFDELLDRPPGNGLQGPCLLIGFGAGLTWGGLSLALP
ncbi:MAG: ketoacyl-ACP synthase III [Verrucomicrobia bacterium]|nr:ketoacyl-ACP synthase III [Verrucomicrobiota bacterium]